MSELSLIEQGLRLQQAGKLAEAARLYRSILDLDPNDFNALQLLGALRCDQGDARQAVELIQQALMLREDPVARLNLGRAWQALGRPDEALAEYDHALALAPGHPAGHALRGDVLAATGRLEDAAAAYCRAAALAPRLPPYNLGIVLRDLGRPDEAEPAFREVIELDPDNADARTNLGLLELQRGDYAAGWRDYEWRWRARGFQDRLGPGEQPQWRGAAGAGGRLRIRAEQGLGDTLQFYRYVPRAAARGFAIELAVQRELLSLLQEQPAPVDAVDRAIPPLQPADWHCPLLSLPLALQAGPAAPSPYLQADPVRCRLWRERLGRHDGLTIGLVWAGSPAHPNDRKRSIDLAELAVLAALPGLRCISVQKQPSEAEAALLKAIGIADFGTALGDFAETAALLAQLDLVVSVDTAVAHLAGALARPVWILVPAVADWRWGRAGTDTPWYPTARLFRQQHGESWRPVVARIAVALGAG
jgi:Flp pilus assembly protein TadD